MKISSAKAKGHRLEALIRDKLIEKFNLTSDEIRISVGSETGEDIKLSRKAQEKIPLKIEAKSRAKFSLYAYYDQAIGHNGDNLEPCVVIKANRRKPLIVIDLNYFLEMLYEKTKDTTRAN